MLKKLIVAVAALALVGSVSTGEASARGGGGGFHGGGGFRGGYGGGYRGGGYGYGALGFGLGLGLGYGAYYGSPYAYNGYYAGGCYLVRRRVFTTYGTRIQVVRTCG